jgi:nucleoid-associated protein YgaU
MRPKLMAAFLAVGILVLIGGGVFVATRPTWHPATSGGAKPARQAASAIRAPVTAQAAHPAASNAANGRSAATATRAANITHARTVSRHSAARSRPSRPVQHSGPVPSHAATAARGGRSQPSVTYTVKPGDTLSGIAEWFSLHGYGSLYAANRSIIGSNPNLIFAGERITISHGVMSLRAAKRQPAPGS